MYILQPHYFCAAGFKRPILKLLACCALLASIAVHAQPTTTLAQLLAALPEPPSTPEQAALWVDRSGQFVHPGLLAAQQTIAAHKSAVERLLTADAAVARTQAGYSSEALMKGIADADIDVQRMKAEPAYAAQVQERIRRMTPAQQMALAQRMTAPMQQDRRITNEAKAMADDSPASKAAYESGQSYTSAITERRAREVRLWQETEAAVVRLNAQRLEPGLPKPGIDYDSIGCQAGCQAQWTAYAAKMLPLMVARDGEALKLRIAALRKQRAWLADEFKPVDRHMAATSYGSKSTSRLHREQIVNYDLSAVGEIDAISDRLLETVRRAALLVQCGKEAVLVPAMCTN